MARDMGLFWRARFVQDEVVRGKEFGTTLQWLSSE